MDLNGAFKTTCKLIFAEEIGELSDFEGYLKEAVVGKQVKSCFSGKSLWVTSEQYCEKAKFFDYAHEHDKIKKLQSKPLEIDDIKDVDSLINGIKENFIYGGDKVLGNSSAIINSDNVVDSHYVLNSSIVVNSRYIVYSYLERNAEYVFGSTSSDESSYVLRCFYSNAIKRCFECCSCIGNSDCFFSYNSHHCNNCMFTFHVKNKVNMIANIQLEKQDYSGLKKKLITEIVGDLKNKKRLGFSIIDLFNI